MIKINLTPVEELENPNWWLFDAAVALVVVVVGFLATNYYLDQINSQIDQVNESIMNLDGDISAVRPQADKYESLTQQVDSLESKKYALQKITESKLVRFLPVILLENLQILKPEGLWFTELKLVDPNSQNQANGNGVNNVNSLQGNTGQQSINNSQARNVKIEIKGQSLSNVIIAEFMTAIKSTQNQAFDKSDIRTQIFFSDVELSFSEVTVLREREVSRDVVDFQLVMSFQEREKDSADLNIRLSKFIDDFKRDGRARMR